MPRAYWICLYQSVSDPIAVQEYAKIAGPAVLAAGGRFRARGGVEQAFEAGQHERTVVVEFDSIEQAIAAYNSDAYKTALKALNGGAVRDIRIVQAVD